MGEHHALGRARRAAGVEDPGEVLLADVGREVRRRGAREQLPRTPRPCRSPCRRTAAGRRRAPGEQHLGARVLQGVAQLGVGVARVERDDHEPAPPGTPVQLEVAVAVRAHDRDAVALREAERRAGHPRAGGSGPTSPRRSGSRPRT